MQTPRACRQSPASARFHTGSHYQLFVNAPHEAIGLVGLDVDLGAYRPRAGAGGADDFTTLSPTFDFGKGFGDLPDICRGCGRSPSPAIWASTFRPRRKAPATPNPNNFNYGFAFEYSLAYLQYHVKDVGLRPPFNQLIPLVEVAFSTPLNRGTPRARRPARSSPGSSGRGSISRSAPKRSSRRPARPATAMAALVQLHFYLDDIFPNSFGRPLFGD